MTTNAFYELKNILETNKGNLYDFICNNYYELTKDELKDLLKEAFALLYEHEEQENIKQGKRYDNFFNLHNEYLKTLKENTSIFEEE